MARRGRPRKSGPRQPNGHLRETVSRPDELHLLALGVDPRDKRIHSIVEARRIAAGASPRNELAATPLGMMLIKQLIDQRLYLAGELYEKNQIRLGRAVAPPGETRSSLAQFLADAAPAVYRDMGGDEGNDFAKQYVRCRWVEREVTARVWDWRGLENVVVKHEPPEFFGEHPTGTKAVHRLQTLQHDLEELARFFDRPPPREEMRGSRPRLYQPG